MSTAPFDIALFAAAIRLTAPLLFVALGELVSERAGVINIGLEGMMLSGAFGGFLGAYYGGSTATGVLAGVLAGLLVGALMALFSITLGGDQIVVGVALNLFAAGVTLFLYRLLFTGDQPTTGRSEPWEVPGLSQLPAVGPVLFGQLPLGYLAYLLVPVVGYVLYRTRSGLFVRTTGELPAAAESAGVSPVRVQWVAVLFAGAMAGLGGAFLSVVQLGFFAENMTSGRGFLALAAVVFGQWRPVGVLAACLVFGVTDALQLRLQSADVLPPSVWVALVVVGLLLVGAAVRSRLHRHRRAFLGVAAVLVVAGAYGLTATPEITLPAQMWLCLPYLLSLLALALTSAEARAPAMIGRPLQPAG